MPHLTARWPAAVALTSFAALVAGCCGASSAHAEEPRPQDTRTFTIDASATTLAAMAAAAGDVVDMSTTSRWTGVLNGAAYRVEVPTNWNGQLVMYAHGYRGPVTKLTIDDPLIRRHLIQNGYAWAASSYSKNYWDARAGVEDTNALALEFTKIAAANGRTLAEPTRIYIVGQSMGGQITAAAIEDETARTAVHKVKYAGAVAMCGALGDTEYFSGFGALQVTAQALAGIPSYPLQKWSEVNALVKTALFTTFPSKPTALGQKYLSVVRNITGGARPMFDLGIAIGGSFPSAWAQFGTDGTIFGILTKNGIDTTAYTYTIDGDAAGSLALNQAVLKWEAAADANRPRTDGLRWVPALNGEFKVPMVTLHTLGDLTVPFSMEQIYQKRAAARGSSAWLVQRAIRGVSHCDFTVAEQVAAFEAMIKWEHDGVKPAGDDVVTPATVAAPTYGCRFTNNALGPDDNSLTQALRPTVVANTPECP